MYKYAIRVFAVALLASVCTMTNAAALSLDVASTRLTITGVTAQGEVVLLGRSGSHESGIPVRKRHLQVLRDADGDGVVTYDMTEVPSFSTWAAVDIESGAFALGAPGNHAVPILALPDVVWRGGTAHVNLRRDVVDVLFVRPKRGAWLLDLWQGGRADGDGSNDANLRVGLGPLRPISGKEAPPPTATPRDVLIMIDIRTLEIYARSAE